MEKRDFSEMVAYFNRRVADMGISQKYKMELLGMITAIEMKHDELMPKWIPVTEALPEEDIDVLLQFPHTMAVGYQEDGFWNIVTCDDLYSGLDEEEAKPIAWLPLPEPWKGE